MDFSAGIIGSKWCKVAKKITTLLAYSLLNFHSVLSQSQLPKPDHIVIAMFENKSYSQMVGSASAPYINSLLADTNAAVFTQSFALTHPSQPNYLMLFSGSNQGVTTDDISTSTPFTTCNLGASLIQNGFTFTGYCEDLPSVGYLGNIAGSYYRKHNPWSNWQGTLANDLAPSVNQPFTAFPSNYNLLPDLCFVVPNIDNCMHNGSISLGDSWLQAHLNSYIQWTLANNSLLILTFDEDNMSEGNRILTFFYGPMVKGGAYSTHISHYDVLRTLEDIYHLPHCGNSASATPIDQIWKSAVSIDEKQILPNAISIFPNPATDLIYLKVRTEKNISSAIIAIKDICGETLQLKGIELRPGDNLIQLNSALHDGIYWVNLISGTFNANCKLVVQSH